MALASCLGGCFILEQPKLSLLPRHRRFRWLTTLCNVRGPLEKSYHSFQGVEVKLVDVPLRPLQPETPHRLVQQQVDWALLERASQGMEVQHEHLQDDLHLHRQEREKAMARLEAFEANTAYTSVLILNGLTLISGRWPVSCSWRGPGFCVLGLMDVDWRRC